MPYTKGSKSSAAQKTKDAAAFAASTKEALEAMETASRETIEATSKASRESISEVFNASSLAKSTEVFDAMAEEGKKTLESMTNAAAIMMTGMTACNAKFVDGLKSGLNFNMAYFETMVGTEAPQEAAAFQVKAFAEAVDLANAKSMEMGKIMTETYAKAYVPLKKRYDESVSAFAKALA
jgi:hypothetical protein